MRRRDRYSNLLWMAGWKDPDNSLEKISRAVEHRSPVEALERLLEDKGYDLLLQRNTDGWCIDLLPTSNYAPNGAPVLAHAYAGPSLGRVALVALREVTMVLNSVDAVRTSTRETRRWVP